MGSFAFHPSELAFNPTRTPLDSTYPNHWLRLCLLSLRFNSFLHFPSKAAPSGVAIELTRRTRSVAHGFHPRPFFLSTFRSTFSHPIRTLRASSIARLVDRVAIASRIRAAEVPSTTGEHAPNLVHHAAHDYAAGVGFQPCHLGRRFRFKSNTRDVPIRATRSQRGGDLVAVDQTSGNLVVGELQFPDLFIELRKARGVQLAVGLSRENRVGFEPCGQFVEVDSGPPEGGAPGPLCGTDGPSWNAENSCRSSDPPGGRGPRGESTVCVLGFFLGPIDRRCPRAVTCSGRGQKDSFARGWPGGFRGPGVLSGWSATIATRGRQRVGTLTECSRGGETRMRGIGGPSRELVEAPSQSTHEARSDRSWVRLPEREHWSHPSRASM